MAEFVLKYAELRGWVRQRAKVQRRVASRHRATVNLPVNPGAIPRGLVHQLANVRRQIQRRVAATQRRVIVNLPVNTGADPRGAVRQRAKVQRAIQRRVASRHRAVANTSSGACFPTRQQIVAIRHDRVALAPPVNTGPLMAQEIKQ